MEMLKTLDVRPLYKTVHRFGLFICPICSNAFEASIHEVKSKRVNNCGCAPLCLPLPESINGFKIVKDLLIIKGRRTAIFQCYMCDKEFTKIITELKTNRTKPPCGCFRAPYQKCKDIKLPKVERLTSVQQVANELGISLVDSQRIYFTWTNIIARCYRETHVKYHRYGGRGITVCDRWRNSFILFALDMGAKSEEKLSIDRIDNDGNYEPCNCRWADQKIQQNNRDNSRKRSGPPNVSL